MNRRKLSVAAWILIFLAFNLHFACPVRDVFLIVDISLPVIAQVTVTLLAFIFGEIGLIIALIVMLTKPQKTT